MKSSSALEPSISETQPDGKRKRFPLGEEDCIIDKIQENRGDNGQPALKTIAEKEQDHKHKVEDSKIRIAIGILAACFMVIVGFSIADAATGVDSPLFSGAFEFAKTIATAIVGYLFATGIKEK